METTSVFKLKVPYLHDVVARFITWLGQSPYQAHLRHRGQHAPRDSGLDKDVKESLIFLQSIDINFGVVDEGFRKGYPSTEIVGLKRISESERKQSRALHFVKPSESLWDNIGFANSHREPDSKEFVRASAGLRLSRTPPELNQ